MLMKKIFLIPLIFVFLLFTVSAKKSNQPKKIPLWASSDTIDQVYPSSEYIARIGYGATPDLAVSFAETEIGKYFQHQVESSTSAFQKSTSGTSAAYSDERSLHREVLITSNVKLFAVNHTDAYLEEKTGSYAVCAFINRNEAWSIFEPKLLYISKLFQKQYENIESEPDSLKKFIMLKKLKPVADEYLDSLYFAKAISAKKTVPYESDIENISSISGAMTSALQESTISIKVINDYENRLRRCISNLLSKEGFIISDYGYAYQLKITVEPNKVIHKKEDNIISAVPGITAELSNGMEKLFVYSKTQKKILGFNEELINGKIYSAIENELKESFIKELNERL